ncbi:MAG: hypothetical protein WEF50_11115 [Myxococcota bacterium]
MDLPQAISSLIAVANALKLAGNAAIQTAIADLNLVAARVTTDLAAELRKNAELQEQNRDLSQRLALRRELKKDPVGNFYWRGAPEEGDGPYCTGCADSEGLAMRLHHHLHPHNPDQFWCPKCKVAVRDPNSPTKPRRPVLHARMAIV